MANTFPPLVSSTSLDYQGIQQLIGSEVLSSCNIRAEANDLFFNPINGLTGYAFDGAYYDNGVVTPLYASWASEGPGLYRGSKMDFPEKALVLATEGGLTIFDQAANSFSVWMSFIQSDLYALLNNYDSVKTLDVGTMTFDSAGSSIIRTNGSWVADGIEAGSTITLSGLTFNNGTYTVVGPMITPYDSMGIVVEEVVVDEEGVGVATTPTVSRLRARAVNYANGVVMVAFEPDQGSDLYANTFLWIDFVRDEVYSNYTHPGPDITLTITSLEASPTVVEITSPVGAPVVGVPATYSAAASGRLGGVYTYNWTFDDATTVAGDSVSHTWMTSGSHEATVSVNVADSDESVSALLTSVVGGFEGPPV